jgi:Protein of unknown function (DUF1404)
MALSSTYLQTKISLLLIGSAVSIAVILFPPLDIIENSNLTVRMIEDILLFVYAILFGYGVERYVSTKANSQHNIGSTSGVHSVITRINRWSKGLIFAMLIPATLLIYWNFPANFDLTAGNIFIRYASDISYLVAAILAGTAITYVPRKFKVLLLYFAFMAVGMMGSMMLVWQPGFYTAYSPGQNTTMNTFMMLFGAFGVVGMSTWLLKVMDVI